MNEINKHGWNNLTNTVITVPDIASGGHKLRQKDNKAPIVSERYLINNLEIVKILDYYSNNFFQ